MSMTLAACRQVRVAYSSLPVRQRTLIAAVECARGETWGQTAEADAGAVVSADPRDVPPINIECRGRVERLEPGSTIQFS
jgi:hypothetical protein